MDIRVLNDGYPHAPHEFQEVVELRARGSGRHAKLHFTPGGTWFVRISLKSDDPRMELYKLGLVGENSSSEGIHGADAVSICRSSNSAGR